MAWMWDTEGAYKPFCFCIGSSSKKFVFKNGRRKVSPRLENSRTSVLYRTTSSETEREEINKTRKVDARRGTVSKIWLVINQDKSHDVSCSSLTARATGESQTLKETKGDVSSLLLELPIMLLCWKAELIAGEPRMYSQLPTHLAKPEGAAAVAERENVRKLKLCQSQDVIVINKHQMTGRTCLSLTEVFVSSLLPNLLDTYSFYFSNQSFW